jgi:uncharacterized membrane protein YdjX (TVP38/TMEM64 family)
VFVLWSAFSAMVTFVSSGVLVPVAVYAWGVPASVGLLCAGWLLGGVGAYGVGRYLGRPVVGTLASAEALARSERWVSRRSSFGLVVLFQLALPSEVPGYVLGLVRYPFGRYLAALALVQLPFAVATVYLTAGLIEGRVPLLLGVGAALAGGVAVAAIAFRRRLRAERAGGAGRPVAGRSDQPG